MFKKYTSPVQQDEVRLYSTTNIKERQAYDNMSELYSGIFFFVDDGATGIPS